MIYVRWRMTFIVFICLSYFYEIFLFTKSISSIFSFLISTNNVNSIHVPISMQKLLFAKREMGIVQWLYNRLNSWTLKSKWQPSKMPCRLHDIHKKEKEKCNQWLVPLWDFLHAAQVPMLYAIQFECAKHKQFKTSTTAPAMQDKNQ